MIQDLETRVQGIEDRKCQMEKDGRSVAGAVTLLRKSMVNTETKESLRDSSEHKSLRDSSEHKSLRDSSEHKSLRGSSEHKSLRDSSEHKSLRDSSEHITVKEKLDKSGGKMAENRGESVEAIRAAIATMQKSHVDLKDRLNKVKLLINSIITSLTLTLTLNRRRSRLWRTS